MGLFGFIRKLFGQKEQAEEEPSIDPLAEYIASFMFMKVILEAMSEISKIQAAEEESGAEEGLWSCISYRVNLSEMRVVNSVWKAKLTYSQRTRLLVLTAVSTTRRHLFLPKRHTHKMRKPQIIKINLG